MNQTFLTSLVLQIMGIKRRLIFYHCFKVHSILVSYFICMRLNVNRSFDVKKITLTKPLIEFIFFKIFFLSFLYKKWTQLHRVSYVKDNYVTIIEHTLET
jgi:hypothetical protein